MTKNIKCISCRFAVPDANVSDKHWTAQQCSNPDSEYYNALLNVTPSGDKQFRITWGGCPCGERRAAQ